MLTSDELRATARYQWGDSELANEVCAAADEIDRLRAEVEELRAALRDIAGWSYGGNKALSQSVFYKIHTRARHAVDPPPGDVR